MEPVFPEPIRRLPEADIPIDGLRAYLSQAASHQILFMQFASDAELAEHSHPAQWGIVVEGQLEITINGVRRVTQGGSLLHSSGRPTFIDHSCWIR